MFANYKNMNPRLAKDPKFILINGCRLNKHKPKDDQMKLQNFYNL